MEGCLFCRIANKEIQARIVHEDDRTVAFEDINPQAPLHVLVVPRRHIATLNDFQTGDAALLGHLVSVARQIAIDRGHGDDGYRIVVNCQAGAGQSVFHVHVHVLAGRPFGWPPG
jgi:histidine triad (HIT) family protein